AGPPPRTGGDAPAGGPADLSPRRLPSGESTLAFGRERARERAISGRRLRAHRVPSGESTVAFGRERARKRAISRRRLRAHRVPSGESSLALGRERARERAISERVRRSGADVSPGGADRLGWPHRPGVERRPRTVPSPWSHAR